MCSTLALDYGQIATACGVSRQAIRQRWLRRTAGSRWFEAWRPARRPSDQVGGGPRACEPAKLSWSGWPGGPYDGARAMPFARANPKYEADSPPSESSGPVPLLAWYVPSQDDANVYVFAGVERDAWRMHTGLLLPPGGARQRSRASTSWRPSSGVENKVIWLRLQQMGEFVRSASSTVERLIAYQIKQEQRLRCPCAA